MVNEVTCVKGSVLFMSLELGGMATLNPFLSRDAFTLSATIPIPSTVLLSDCTFHFHFDFCLPSYVSQVIPHKERYSEIHTNSRIWQSERRI